MEKLEIFKTNPNLKEVHMTSDGQCFYNEYDAKMHAKTLKDKTVELVVNPNQLEVIVEDEDEDEQEAKAKAEAEAKAEQEAEAKAKAEQEPVDGGTSMMNLVKEETKAKKNEAKR